MTVFVAGRINYDTIISVGGVFERGKKFVGRVIAEGVGGTGANIAISMARAGTRDVKLFGAVGHDLKDLIMGFLSSEGVGTEHIVVLGKATGRAYVIVDDYGESTIVSIPGANNELDISHIPQEIEKALAVVVANIPRHVAVEVLARFRGNTVFMDPGNIWNPLEIVNNVEYECFIMPNENEYLHYIRTRKGGGAEDSKSNCLIIVKRGEKGAVLYDYKRGRVIEVNALPLKKLGLKPYSTSGCGDVFTGVFATVYLEKRRVSEALVYASIAAGLKATRILSYDSPKREELEKFVERYSSLLNVNESRI
ncbi:MAG: PfkB family carbohydrate kinase [Ignisphaera sp.]